MNLQPKYKNYLPKGISFSDGYYGPRGDVGFFMKADFQKAKKIIQELISNGKDIDEVEMGLDGDWNENSQTIYKDGEFYQYQMYGVSVWAEPIILVEYNDGTNECYDCWEKVEK